MSVIGQWLSYPASTDRVLSLIGIEVHWAILQYVLGLPFMAFIALLIYARSGDERWKRLAKTLAKGFVIVFAVGAGTGTASEFGLVLLWPNLTEAAGRYIYFPLYMEIFAFMMEVVFIYMLFYTWNKVDPKGLAVIAFFAFLGAWFSGSMIVSVNSYMVAPTGVQPAYDPQTGQWDPAGPRILLAVPNDYVPLLNLTLLQSAGMTVAPDQPLKDATLVYMPARIVQQLAREAWAGYTVNQSILLNVVNKTTVQYLAQNDPATLQQILNTPVKKIVDDILVRTIKYVSVYTVTFKSPVYPGSILHVLGAALTVSSFTVMAAYAARLPKAKNKKYREYAELAFKYSTLFALIMIIIQGFVFGHLMGSEIAHYNPEKMAAMEGQTDQHFSITKALGLDKLMALIAYGSSSAHLPNYDTIPDYCNCQLTSMDDQAMAECKPPIIIHYLYYTKTGLAILLGLYALIAGYYLVVKKTVELPGYMAKTALLTPVVAQIVSFFGWAVREIGRKPWTIYGIMTPDVAHTVNPLSTGAVALIALYFIALLAVLAYAVWRFLWIPGKIEAEGV